MQGVPDPAGVPGLNERWCEYRPRAEGACGEQPVLGLLQGSCLPFSCREHCELSQFSRGVPPISASRRLRGLLDHAWVEIYRLLINGILEDSAKSFSIPQTVCSVAGSVPGVRKCRFIAPVACCIETCFLLCLLLFSLIFAGFFFFYYFFFKLCLDIIYMTYI